MTSFLYEVQLHFRDGPLAGGLALVLTNAEAGETVEVRGFKYRLNDGPALRIAQKDKVAHPSLSASADFAGVAQMECLN